MMCENCMHHARWKNDKEETGCFCFIGYDHDHELICKDKADIQCAEFFDTRIISKK